MSSTGNIAWLLNVTAERQIALAECELLEYAMSPQLHKVPAATPHCSSVMLWRFKPVPVMQLSMLLGNGIPVDSITGICVVAYQKNDDSQLQYVGLPVTTPPVKIDINENQACSPTEELDRLWSLPGLSLAFFSHDAATVPIVDLKELCAARNRELLNQLYEPGKAVRVPKCA